MVTKHESYMAVLNARCGRFPRHVNVRVENNGKEYIYSHILFSVN